MKKLTLLFVLLCASVIGWAIDWSGYAWIGNGSGNGAYTDAMKIDLPSGFSVVNIQSSFGTEAGIYITTPSDLGLTCDLGEGKFATQGTGMLLYLSAFTLQETPVTVTSGGTDYIVTVYWKDGTTGGGGGQTPEPTATEASCTVVETGYQYTFSNTNTGAVTLIVTLDNAIAGYVNPLVYNATNVSTTGSSSDGKVFTFNLGTFAEGAELTYRTYFPYENADLFQASGLTYTVGTSCSGGSGGGETTTGLCGMEEYENNVEDDYKIKLTSTIIDGKYIVCAESTKEGKTISRVATDNIWCSTSNGNLQIGLPANHKVIAGKLYFIIPSSSAPTIYTGDGVYVYFSDNEGRSFAGTHDVPLTECSEAVDYGIDFTNPSITAASLISNTSAEAVISITATDNVAVTACAVYDGTAYLGDFAVVEGKITVTELMFNHAYTLTIKAKDATGNISANSVDVAVTTNNNTDIIDTSAGSDLGNMALSSAGASATATTGNAGAAIDNNTGSRWESAASDPQVWTLDLGQERVFNNIQIRWEGAYGKTFTLAVSNDNTNWTIVHYVKGQSLAEFPYEQSIDLPQLKARYIRFRGIERGTGYGYSFWEFRVFFAGEPPVLTTMTASIDKRYCQISTGTANISLSCKDQYNQDIVPGEVTYTILPDASYGTVTAGVFTPAKPGLISITAQAGLVVSNTIQIWGTSSTNLAYNHLHSASTGESVIDERPAFNAVDNNEGTEWQSHAGTDNTDEARTYDAWLIVDLGDKYDIELVAVKFEGASSQIYRIEFTDDLASEWKSGVTYSGGAGINARLDEHSALTNNSGVQYVRLFSTKAATQYGMKVQELRVFGSVAVSQTKTVSAVPNNNLYGTATVKQGGVAVNEVETGSTVTFSAVANDGYIFVNWSNGETEATFDAEVNAALNLTANFRALGTTYCNTEVTSTRDDDVHTAYATMKRTSANHYKLVVRSAETLGNFTGTTLMINGNENLNLNNLGTLTDNNHVLTYAFESTTPPSMTSGYLYLNVPGSKFTECWFTRLTNIEYEVECNDDNVPVESISLNYNEATIEIEATKTLVVSFNPVYATDKSITWTTTNGSVASVDGGVVTANAVGTATITAETANGKTASCDVTVEAITEKTCWGEGTDFTYQDNTISWYYSITRNVNKTLTYYVELSRDVTGLGNLDVVIDNDVWHHMAYNAETMSASYTTEGTYETDAVLADFFYFEGHRLNFSYTVGSVCDKPSVDVTGVEMNHSSAELLIGETVTLSASVVPANADDKAIVWENSNPSVASFNEESGLVTALAVGSTTITAKSHADASILATCVVTVTNNLEPATWYGSAIFKVGEEQKAIAVNYSITRTANRTLHYTTSLSESVTGMVMQVNDGDFHNMSQDGTARIAEWTSTATYTDDTNLNFFFYPTCTLGAGRWDVAYTVGSSNTAPNTLVALRDYDTNDNNNTKLEEFNNHAVDVYLTRTFANDGYWYTLCLPFNLSNEQLTEVFGAGYTLATMSGSEDRGSLIHLNFDYVHELVAGKPYLFMPGQDVNSNPVFSGVTIQNVNPSATPQKVESTYMNFEGIFNAQTLTDSNVRFIGDNNYLYSPYSGGGTEMGAFRCYFTIPANAPAGAPGKAAKIVFAEEISTGISNVQGDYVQCTKVLKNGQLLIMRDGRTYNAQGVLIQ